MNPKTILWPTDLTVNSIHALDHARDLAMTNQARIVALYVGIDLKNYQPFWGNFPSPELYERFETWELAEAKERMTRLCSEKLAQCPGWEVKVVTGDPATEILKTAEEKAADLVVMSVHGVSQCRLKPGEQQPSEVTSTVIEKSKAPVYLVNPCL